VAPALQFAAAAGGPPRAARQEEYDERDSTRLDRRTLEEVAMKRMPRGSVVVASALALSSLGSARDGFAQQAPRAYILDSGAHSLVALELPSGKRVGMLALPGSPWAVLQSPDGSRLVVLDRGPGEDKRERGYKATGRSSATVVDPATLKEVGRVELGFGLSRWHFSPDSRRLTVLCPGYEAKNPAQALIRELVNIDLATGRETGRLTVEAGSMPIVASRDGQSLALIQGLPRTARFPYPQSRLVIVDLAGPSIRAKLEMGGWNELYTDGAYFYLLDTGKPDKDAQKNRNGTVQVASVARGMLEGSLDAGRDPRGLYQDEEGGQVFIPSAGPPGAAEGQLRVVRGAELAATLDVAANPRLLKRERDVVFVVGEKAVTLVDPAALQVTATIPLAKGNEGLVDDDDLPTQLEVSPDGRRAFVLYGVHNKVAVLDLEEKRAVDSTKTGRGGKKLFGNVMGVMFGMAGALAAGYSPWAYATPSMLAVRPDGRYAYAINSQTKDVTVVDGATGKPVEIIAGGGYALKLLKGGQVVVEVSDSGLRLIDTERNAQAAEITLHDLRGLFRSPDQSVAVALAKQVVLVLDGASGRELARLTDFVSPDGIVFEEPGPATDP
jgi:DNA-binding beta-propeller fold protein YncE